MKEKDFTLSEKKDFTHSEKSVIRDYFEDTNYPQPHGEVIAVQLLSAMVASGYYSLEDYPKLVEYAIKLTCLLVVELDKQLSSELRDSEGEDNLPKPPASEGDLNSDPDSEAYDPIPF